MSTSTRTLLKRRFRQYRREGTCVIHSESPHNTPDFGFWESYIDGSVLHFRAMQDWKVHRLVKTLSHARFLLSVALDCDISPDFYTTYFKDSRYKAQIRSLFIETRKVIDNITRHYYRTGASDPSATTIMIPLIFVEDSTFAFIQASTMRSGLNHCGTIVTLQEDFWGLHRLADFYTQRLFPDKIADLLNRTTQEAVLLHEMFHYTGEVHLERLQIETGNAKKFKKLGIGKSRWMETITDVDVTDVCDFESWQAIRHLPRGGCTYGRESTWALARLEHGAEWSFMNADSYACMLEDIVYRYLEQNLRPQDDDELYRADMAYIGVAKNHVDSTAQMRILHAYAHQSPVWRIIYAMPRKMAQIYQDRKAKLEEMLTRHASQRLTLPSVKVAHPMLWESAMGDAWAKMVDAIPHSPPLLGLLESGPLSHDLEREYRICRLYVENDDANTEADGDEEVDKNKMPGSWPFIDAFDATDDKQSATPAVVEENDSPTSHDTRNAALVGYDASTNVADQTSPIKGMDLRDEPHKVIGSLSELRNAYGIL
jgi:hypothetical protein